MTKTVVKSRVGSDGILHLSVPLGASRKDREVTITIEEVPSRTFDGVAWREFIEATAGKWQGEFELPSLGLPEEREALG